MRSCRRRRTTSSCPPSAAALHAAYARAIDARPRRRRRGRARARLVELAHHWTAAHEPARALAAAIDAGDASRAVYAYADAARQYERAIELWDIVPADDRPPDRDLIDLYDAASAAATLVGDAARAVTLAQRAIELVDGTTDGGSRSAAGRERRAKARERGGSAAWLAGDTATSIRLLEEAVELLEGTPPSARTARVLAGLAQHLMLAGRSAESVPFAEGAIAAARTIGDQGIETLATNVLGVDLASLGNIAAGVELLRQSLALALRLDDPTEVPRAYANLGSVLEMGGFVEEALEVTLAGAESARRYGTRAELSDLPRGQRRGDADRARTVPEAARLLERNANRVLPGVSDDPPERDARPPSRADRRPGRCRSELAIARAEAGGIDDAQFAIDIHSFGTEVALWGGDPATALAIARDGFERLVDMDDAIILGQLALPAVRAAADIAVMARAARSRGRGGDRPWPRRRTSSGDTRPPSSGWRSPTILPPARSAGGWRSVRRSSRGRAAPTIRSGWDAVRPALTARPAPFLEAYVLWRAAEALAGSGEMAAAGRAIARGLRDRAAIGAGLLVSRMEGLGRRLRVDLTQGAVREAAGDYGALPPTAEPRGARRSVRADRP